MTKSLFNSILLHKDSISRLRFLIFILLLLNNEWLFSQSNTISITTSSCTNLNGIYTQNGTNNGYPKYTKGTAVIINEFGFSGPEWKIMDNGVVQFTSTANYAPRPSGLETTWIGVNGCTMSDISGSAVWQPILTVTVNADTVAEATPVNEVTYTFTTSEAFPEQVLIRVTDDEPQSSSGNWALGDWQFDNSNNPYADINFTPSSTSVSVKIDVLDDPFVETTESSGLAWSLIDALNDYGVTYPSTLPAYVITSENDPLSLPLTLHVSNCGEGTICFTNPLPSSFGATADAGVTLNHFMFVNGKPRYAGNYTDVVPDPDIEYTYDLYYENSTPPVWKLSVSSYNQCSEKAVYKSETDPLPCGPGSSSDWVLDPSESIGNACTNGTVLIDCSKPKVNLTVSSNTAFEANPTDILITVTASEAVTSNETVTLTVTDIDNVLYNDFTLNTVNQSTITITIPAGMSTGSATFKVLDDEDIEGQETAALSLVTPSSGITLGDTVTRFITIMDDEACGILNGNITLSTQTQVNELLTVTFPGCTNFVGDLTIQDDNDNVDNITYLDSLSGLNNIGGTLTITENNVLTNLNGISADSIFSLLIVSNPALTNLNGLSSLSGAQSILIESNAALTNISGLSSLEMCLLFFIKNNPALTTIDGLSSLQLSLFFLIENNSSVQSIGGFSSLNWALGLTIINNDDLVSIGSFPAIQALGGIHLENNDALTNIGTYPVLDSIRLINIINNDALTNVDELASFSTLLSDLNISENDVLINLDGLANLDSVGGIFNLTNNGMLSQCCGIYPIINEEVNNGGIAIGGAVTISGNLVGCNTATEVIDECAVPPLYENIETGAKFGTLQDAIDMATTGDTIKLLADVTETMAVTVNKNIYIKASGFNLIISHINLTIESGKLLVWLEDELTIQSGAKIINNGILHNNATIIHEDIFTNTGTYKGSGIWQGNFVNYGRLSPGGL